MQDMTVCFKLRKTNNQYEQLCSSISPASSTSSINERDYSDYEQYDEESTDDETEIAELNFENRDPDFHRDHSVAHELFRTKTKDKPFLKKPTSSELFPHVDTSDLIQKLRDFAREADSDLQTLLEEQLNDPVLPVVRKTSDTTPKRHLILTNLKPYYHITTSLNNFSTSLTLTSPNTEKRFRIPAKPG